VFTASRVFLSFFNYDIHPVFYIRVYGLVSLLDACSKTEMVSLLLYKNNQTS